MTAMAPFQSEKEESKTYGCDKEWEQFAARIVRAGMQPESHFLLIVRTLERRGEVRFSETAHFGIAGSSAPPLSIVRTALVVAVRRRITCGEIWGTPVGDCIHIARDDVRGMPLDDTVPHPRHHHPVGALEIVQGIEAIEERCLSLRGYAEGLAGKFLAACEALSWHRLSVRFHEARAAYRQQLMGALFAVRFSADRRGALLRQALRLGFDADPSLVRIHGRWWRTSDIIKDMSNIPQ